MKKLLKKLTNVKVSLSKMMSYGKRVISSEKFKPKRKMYVYLGLLFLILAVLKVLHIPPMSCFGWGVVFLPAVIMAVDMYKYVNRDDKKDDK